MKMKMKMLLLAVATVMSSIMSTQAVPHLTLTVNDTEIPATLYLTCHHKHSLTEPLWKVNDEKPSSLDDSVLSKHGATYTEYNLYNSTVRLEAQDAIRGWTVSCWVADIPSKKVTLLLGVDPTPSSTQVSAMPSPTPTDQETTMPSPPPTEQAGSDTLRIIDVIATVFGVGVGGGGVAVVSCIIGAGFCCYWQRRRKAVGTHELESAAGGATAGGGGGDGGGGDVSSNNSSTTGTQDMHPERMTETEAVSEEEKADTEKTLLLHGCMNAWYGKTKTSDEGQAVDGGDDAVPDSISTDAIDSPELESSAGDQAHKGSSDVNQPEDCSDGVVHIGQECNPRNGPKPTFAKATKNEEFRPSLSSGRMNRPPATKDRTRQNDGSSIAYNNNSEPEVTKPDIKPAEHERTDH